MKGSDNFQADLQAQLSDYHKRLEALRVRCERAELALQKAQAALAQQGAERLATLRASEAMFRYFLAQAKDGYVIVNTQEHITYANARARLYLGLEVGNELEEASIPFMGVVHKHYRCEPKAAWTAWPKKLFVKGSPVPLFLVRPETTTSAAFWLRVSILDVPAGMDESSGSIIRLEDVTEQTALQDELNKFHSMISHKLRTPLVPLYSGLRYVVDNVEILNSEDIRDFLTEALFGAQRLRSEIEDIVRYISSPSAVLSGSGFALSEFDELLQGVVENLDLTSVTLAREGDFSGVRFLFSKQSLELILWELLENAQKFHPQHAPVVDVRLFRSAVQKVCIHIRDDGVRLSPEQLVRMWIPYYQGDKFTTGQVKGMGLGLSMVSTQVWGVGGTCRAFNRDDGPGIVVELCLPALDENVRLD